MKAVLGQTNKTKVACIGQIIVQTFRSKSVIAPVQLGLEVQLHHHFDRHNLSIN